MYWGVGMKRLIVGMITLVGIVTFSAPYDKVLADQATSTAGIRFVEGNDSSTDPNVKNPPEPGGEINLPQTGGKAATPYYVIGVPSHAHQVKISYYPQNENFVHFARIYCFGEIHIFSLMAM